MFPSIIYGGIFIGAIAIFIYNQSSVDNNNDEDNYEMEEGNRTRIRHEGGL
jgi:hypothetical protein